jgi:hypothetical protein
MRSLGCLLAWLLLVPQSLAQTVYKCEQDGRVIYAQMPCAPNAHEVDARPAAGAADTAAAARARTRTMEAQSEVRRIESERESQRRQTAMEREIARSREEDERAARCDYIAQERVRAERRSKEYRVRDNIRREAQRARDLGAAEYLDCK